MASVFPADMMLADQQTSIIIPNFNRADALPLTLQTLAEQTVPCDQYEVIVVDDGSTDGSITVLQELADKVPYTLTIYQQSRRRQGAARNLGAGKARFPLLLFLDSDTVSTQQMIAAHQRLQREQGPALVAGARRFWPDACTTIFTQVQHGDRLDRDQFEERGFSFQEVFSSNFSLPRRLFGEISGFDETLWAYEDTDLAYRVEQAGIPLIFSGEALGYHNHPMTLRDACRQQFQYQRHAAFFLYKHPELAGQIGHLWDKAPLRIGVDSPRLMMRKSVRRVLALTPFLKTTEWLVWRLEKAGSRKALRFLYPKVLGSYILTGYRQGLAELSYQLDRPLLIHEGA